jgi:hypothetical protein
VAEVVKNAYTFHRAKRMVWKLTPALMKLRWRGEEEAISMISANGGEIIAATRRKELEEKSANAKAGKAKGVGISMYLCQRYSWVPAM